MLLDFKRSNGEQINYCETCFPRNEKSSLSKGEYVDLLEFSKFNGVSHPITSALNSHRRFLSDFRYSWSVPLVHDYPCIENEVLSSSRVRNTISKLSKITEGNSTTVLHNRAVLFLTEIRARLSKWICKCCAYILYKVFRRLMGKLLVCPNEMLQVQRAEKTGVPLVYLPLHRSHLDYLLITWCNWHYGLKLPHIASGDNLNLCGLGWLLRATGAFFIRRRVHANDERGNDILYRAILHSYIEHILSNNMPLEFFLEGTRSRFGKVLTPKNGLISNVVEAVQHGFIGDCYLVPVSYTYDAVLEGVFLGELMGVPKVRESVIGVFRGVFAGLGRSGQCGVVRMHYGRPVLLTEYLSTITATLVTQSSRPVRMTKMPTSFSYRELVPWHRNHSETVDDRSMIRAIGFHVVYDAQMMCSVSPVAVVSCLILAKWREKVSKHIFEKDCEWLCEEIIAAGGDVIGYQSKTTPGSAIVEYAFQFLENCARVDDAFIAPIITHSSFVQLAYNKNSVVCRFSVKTVIAIAFMCRCVGKPVMIDEVVEDSLSLCDWLQFEFLFCRPCENLREITHVILKDWVTTGLLIMERDDLASGDSFPPSKFKIRDSKSRDYLLFFSNLVRPFLQSLFILCQFIANQETPVNFMSDELLVRKLCEDSLAGHIRLPFVPQLEAINSDSFKNSLRILKEKGIVQHKKSVEILQSAEIIKLLCNLDRVLKIFV